MSIEDPGYHQLAPKLQQSVEEHHVQLFDHIQKMREVLAHPELDLRPAYNLDHLLKTQPELVPEFEKDPEGFAKQRVGLELPKGFHLHFIDAKGKFWPQTDPPASKTETEESDEQPWARAEIRVAIRNATGVGTIVIGFGDPPVEGIPHVPPSPL